MVSQANLREVDASQIIKCGAVVIAVMKLLTITIYSAERSSRKRDELPGACPV